MPLEYGRDILCHRTERTVALDNTVRYGRVLQIPATPARHHYVKATVRVHEYPDMGYNANRNPNPVGRVRRFDATRRRPVDKWTAARGPLVHRANRNNRSGQMDQNRPNSLARQAGAVPKAQADGRAGLVISRSRE